MKARATARQERSEVHATTRNKQKQIRNAQALSRRIAGRMPRSERNQKYRADYKRYEAKMDKVDKDRQSQISRIKQRLRDMGCDPI